MSGADVVLAHGIANLLADLFGQRDSEDGFRLRFPTVRRRRYQVETSTHLLQRETTTITDVMRCHPGRFQARGATSESRFYRVSVLHW